MSTVTRPYIPPVAAEMSPGQERQWLLQIAQKLNLLLRRTNALDASDGAGAISGMVSGQIPIAASDTTITSSADLSGDVTSNSTLVTTLATVNPNIGTWNNVTVNGKGLVTAAENQSYLTTITAASTYLPLSGGALSGQLTVAGSVWSSGANAAVAFEPRDAPGTVWLLYAAAGTCRLWKGTDALYLDPAGNLQIFGGTAIKVGGGSWTAPSDSRLKRGVIEYKSGLEQVLALRPIVYQYNGKGGLPDDNKSYVGLDADATETVMPELVGRMMVHLDPPPPGEHPPPDTEIKTVDASALIFTLVNACRELSARVQRIENMLASGERG